MRRATLLCLAVLALPHHALAAEPLPVQALVAVNDSVVTLAATEKPGEVTVSFAGNKVPSTWQLPKKAGRVTEIVAGPWLSGLAWAVEATDEHGERSYYWATAFVSEKEKCVGTINGGPIAKTKQDLDLVGVRNSAGDSIYITLLKHRRDFDQSLQGYAFIHNCPITGPLDEEAVLNGTEHLLQLTSSPGKVEATGK